MRLNFDNYVTLLKVGAVIVAGVYLYRRGVSGVVSDTISGIGDAVSGVGNVVVEKSKPIVYGAVKDSALNVTETSKTLQNSLGIDQNQADFLEALALGNLGA